MAYPSTAWKTDLKYTKLQFMKLQQHGGETIDTFAVHRRTRGRSRALYRAALRVLAIIALAWAAAGPAAAQLVMKLSVLDQPVAHEQQEYSSARGSTRASIALGEPVSIRVELINTGAAPMTLTPNLDPAAGMTSLRLILPYGTPERITREQWEKRDFEQPASSLRPGERLVLETFLFGVLGEELRLQYLFPQPGVYQIFARYEDQSVNPPAMAVSNRIQVTVGPALPGWTDLQAAGILEEIEGLSHSTEEQKARLSHLRTLLATLPRNPYVPWLAGSGEKPAPPPIPPSTQAAVRRTLQRFLAAFEAGKPEVAQFLTPDFRYNGALDREQTIRQMQENLQKMRGSRHDVQANILTIARDESSGKDLAVTARLRFQGPAAAQEHLFRFSIRSVGGAWLIRRWDRDQ